MGLFINNEKHPEVFKNSEIQKERNQEIHRRDFLAELLEALLENEAELKRKIINEMLHHNSTNEQLTNRIEKIDMQQQSLIEKMDQQGEYHTEILTRLDKQEALTEKLARQINHIRSILFERTNFLAEKIDDGYKLTSKYVYKLLTGSDRPLTFYTLKTKQEEKQNQED